LKISICTSFPAARRPRLAGQTPSVRAESPSLPGRSTLGRHSSWPRFRLVILTVSALVLGLLLPAVAALDEIRVGVAPTMSSAGLYLAQDKGYFQAEGLKVKLIPFRSSGPEMLPLLATDKLEVGGGNLGASFYNALGRGVRLRAVADKGSNLPGCGYLSLVTRSGLVVRRPEDLRGRTVAFTGKGVSQEVVVDRYLRSGGLGIGDLKIVTMPYADTNMAMARGSLDATVQIEPLLTEALARGWVREVRASSQIDPYQQSAAILYSETFSQNTGTARRFMRAYLRGVRDYHRAFVSKRAPGPEIAIMTRYVPVKDKSLYTRMRPVGLNPDGYLNARSMAEDLKWYQAHGYVKQCPPLEEIVDHSFARWAARELGPRTH